MKIKDIKNFPCKVKLNEKFNLEESIDPGSIIQVNSCKLDFDNCYKVLVTVQKEDIPYNISISKSDWYNSKTGNYTLDFYSANKDSLQKDGSYKFYIYVMEDDDCFDEVDDNKVKDFLFDVFFQGNSYASIPEDDFNIIKKDFEKWYSENSEKVRKLYFI